ncbi:MAG: histidinol-phosphate transaminase [Mariprofundaceae bacterium]|nr:histidinol-phosphate transaminase [Mariprofundaceae bacterium]
MSETDCMEIDWMARAVAQTQGLYPYIPGKPVEQLLREKGLPHAVKLASNENAYGPSPKAMAAMQMEISEVHRYPDGDCTALKMALAERHVVKTSQVLIGNGSNEVLELLIRCFAGVGDEVVYSQRGFIVYALATQAAGAIQIAVPDTAELGHDLHAMAAAVTDKTKVVCIANPNNPTGTLLNNDELQTFLDARPRHIVVILDEAYDEFVADVKSDSLQTLKHPGLVVSRTFSKAYGLAGCRVGYAVADASLLAVVNRFREPFNVNNFAQVAALAALDDEEWVMDKVAKIKTERTRLETAFDGLGVSAGKSYANFVLLKHAKAGDILNELEDQGIIPRPLAGYGLKDYLRISVGTSEENDALLQGLDVALKQVAV